jgi:predicted membrane protein
MEIFTIIGMITFVVFIMYIFFVITDYFIKIKTKRKELIDFKNKIEDEDLKKSWINLLEKKYNSPYWNEPHNFFK